MERQAALTRRVVQLRDQCADCPTFELLEAENELLRIDRQLQIQEIRSLRYKESQDMEIIQEQGCEITNLRHLEATLQQQLCNSREECLRVRNALRLEKESRGKTYFPSTAEIKAGKIHTPIKRDMKMTNFFLDK